MKQIGTTMHLAASVDQVLVALADPRFHQARADRSSAVSSTTSAGIREGQVRVQRTEGYPPSILPPIAARLVGEQLRIVVDEQVPVLPGADGWHDGRWRVTVPGMGIRAEGTLRLGGSGDASTMHVQGQVTAANPLLGGAMESAAASVADRLFADEGAALAAWLSADR